MRALPARLKRGISRLSRSSSALNVNEPQVLDEHMAVRKLRREQLHDLAVHQAAKLTPEILAEVTGQKKESAKGKDVLAIIGRIRRGDLEQIVLKLLANGALVLNDNDEITAAAEKLQAAAAPAERIRAAFAASDPKGSGYAVLDVFIKVMSQPTIYEHTREQEPLDEEHLVQLFAEYAGKGAKKIDYAQFSVAWSAKVALQNV